MNRRPLRLLPVLALMLGLLAGTPAVTATADTGVGTDKPAKPVTVMTRNIYLGADIQRPIRATAGLTGTAALIALAHENHAVRETVDATNFPVRSELLAAEIAEAKPDLIGLQEVALWRSGPLELPPGPVPNSTTVDYDFLEILLEDLSEAGVTYRAAQIQVESDVEAPAFTGIPGTPTFGNARDVRVTMHDVILVRESSSLRVLDSGGSNYAARLTLPIAGMPVSFIRGYGWVDVRAGSHEFRFINTHLEAFSSTLALLQAQQLAAEAASYDGTTVLVCDCNSDPLNGTVKPGDGHPHWAAYRFLTGAAGFTDAWLTGDTTGPGDTSGLSETVDDATAAGFDHRIDLILVRAAAGETPPIADRGEVTGDELADRDDATGLWPSDHAGVWLRLRGL
jgi:endonuclease/exonuclease/phosphatase family metal-dependent hydrolase